MIGPVRRAGANPGETVGQRIKRLRLKQGRSQRELSGPGISYAYISRLEAGTRQPSIKALRRLAAKLGVTASYLETGSDIDEHDRRELRLADAELALRFGDASDAEGQLVGLLREARLAGDVGIASRARLALALVADGRGDHAGAVAAFEEACALDHPSALDCVGVFVVIGRAYGAIGRVDREIALYEACIAEVADLGAEETSVMMRYRVRLSYALSDAGEFKRAERMLNEALKAETVADDRYMRMRVYWSLARLTEMEGRSRMALRYARRAIALLEETEDTVQRAPAHLLAAWIMNSAGDAAGAQSQLGQAESLLAQGGGAADDMALLNVEKARTRALGGDGDSAVRLALEAIAMLGDQHDATLGTAFWALGTGRALQGDIDAASDAYVRSVELLEQNRRWREAAEACRAWASDLHDAGRAEEALDVLRRAERFASYLPNRQAAQRKRSQATRNR